MGSVVALGGQVGGAKLADGLYRLRGHALTVIVNTGDDYEHLGLSFSPDIDTMLYTLAGIASPGAGWEPEGETQALHSMIRALGGPDRPILGDRSAAAPLLRAEGLASGRTLCEITSSFCRHLGIAARVVPMTDDRVRTYVITEGGAITFQDYFMTLACEPAVRGFQYAGANEARIPDAVIEALHADDLEAVILCPANPYHVIRPILEIEGMKELLLKRGAPVIAVTPIIGDRALKGSAAKMMRELGRERSARSVAGEYLRIIDGFVLDSEDLALADSVRSLGIDVVALPTIMRSIDDRVALAQEVLDFAVTVRARMDAEAA
ncbi:MAG TPA: 2-phospho-L-lactate transferase CofD family protein [Burkholderiales bacterium]|nr:2-phospho-L-lactate transferase CofD family protein [Burkholderiales bacterium]